MYRIVLSDGTTVLYDTKYPNNYMMTEPKLSREIGQPGALNFSMLPSHPAYSSVNSMETYLSAYEYEEREDTEGQLVTTSEELFYGRVIDVDINKTTGVKKNTCAGALDFLNDAEIAPFEEDWEATGQEFFEWCINSFNSEIENDSKRRFGIGLIDHSRSSETRVFKISSYTKVKSALESYLINDYGGYLRVREYNGAHYIDWIEEYDEPDYSPIQLTKNIISQENSITANEFYTLIRPVGKNNIGLTEGTIAVSSALVSRYGRIINTVSFKEAETEADLRAEANAYIARMGKGLGKNGSIKMVDLHFLNNTIQRVRLGAVYSNIAGFEGEEMTIAQMDQDFANPVNDMVALKNQKELYAGTKGSATGRGTITKQVGYSQGFQNVFKHITETEDSLSIHAELIELHGERIEETAMTFERYARTTDNTLGQIQGSGVLQNSDRITQIVGNFSSKYVVVPSARLEGKNPHNCGYFVPNWTTVTQEQIDDGYWISREIFGSINAALAGNPLDTSSLTAGQEVMQMIRTNDATPQSGVTYYAKGLSLGSGTEFTITEEGQELTVGTVLTRTEDKADESLEHIETIEGSALWTGRNNITGVVGELEVHTDGQGNRYLLVKSGGGMKIQKNNVQYGIYSEDTLKGGIIVNLLNDNTVTTHIKGNRVILGDVDDQTATTVGSGYQVLAQSLYAAQADIAELKADQITANYLESNEITVGRLKSTGYVQISNTGLGIDAHGGGHFSSIYLNGGSAFTDCLINATLSQDGKTLYLHKASGGEPIPFSKTVATLVSGSWSNAIYTAAPDPNGEGSAVTEIHKAYVASDPLASSAALRVYHDSNVVSHNIFTSSLALSIANDNSKVYLNADGDAIAAISTQAIYDAGETAGATGIGLTRAWLSNEVQVYKQSGSQSQDITFTVTAGNTITYDSTNHKYTGNCTATADGAVRHTSAYDSGTQAYTDGLAAGSAAIGLTRSWVNNQVSVVKSSSSQSQDISFSVTAGNTITYDSATHKYTGNCTATADGAVRHTSAYESGTEAYYAGTVDGVASVKVARSWVGNTLTVTPSTSSQASSLSFTVTAGHTISYNSSTHKYTGNCTATVEGAVRNSVAYDSGTKAYDDGKASVTASVGGWSSGWAKITLSNGKEYWAGMPSSASWSIAPYSRGVTVTATIGGVDYSHSFPLSS